MDKRKTEWNRRLLETHNSKRARHCKKFEPSWSRSITVSINCFMRNIVNSLWFRLNGKFFILSQRNYNGESSYHGGKSMRGKWRKVFFKKISEIGRKTRRVKKIDPPHNECIKETHCCDKIERDFPFSFPPVIRFHQEQFSTISFTMQ